MLGERERDRPRRKVVHSAVFETASRMTCHHHIARATNDKLTPGNKGAMLVWGLREDGTSASQRGHATSNTCTWKRNKPRRHSEFEGQRKGCRGKGSISARRARRLADATTEGTGYNRLHTGEMRAASQSG